MSRLWSGLALLVLAGLAGACFRSARPSPLAPDQLAAARVALELPLPGNLAALYRLRVPASGGLRLAVLTLGGAGRLSISEPFGSALSVTAWTAGSAPELYDLQNGCRLAATDLSTVLGAGRLPMPQAVRLLAGRLPALPEDEVEIVANRLLVRGQGWACTVQAEPDPWRVVAVEELVLSPSRPGWRLELAEHTRSLPGFIRIEHPQSRWAELTLVRLQWDSADQLPALPELPPCDSAGSGRADREGRRN